jgi:hypothetical protein
MSKNEPPRPEDVVCLRFPPGLGILGPIFEGKHTVPGIPLGASAESRKGARLIRPPRWATAIVPKWCMVRGAEAQTGAEGPQPLGVWVSPEASPRRPSDIRWRGRCGARLRCLLRPTGAGAAVAAGVVGAPGGQLGSRPWTRRVRRTSGVARSAGGAWLALVGAGRGYSS